MSNSEPHDLVQSIKEGIGPLLFHVRDEEESIRALPLSLRVVGDEYESVSLVLGRFSGSIALPPRAIAQSVPDNTCAHWMWEDGSSLLLLEWGYSHLPLLESITRWRAGTSHILVNDRPMALRIENADETQVGQIDGYLDDHSSLGVNIHASNSAKCDELVAAVTTLRLTRGLSTEGV
jgi:hypothetical protein